MTEATPPTGREERGTTPRRSLLGQAGREAGGLRSAGGGRQRERAGKTRGWGAAGLLPELAEDLPGAPDRSGGDARRGREGLEGALPRVPAAAEPVLSVDGGRRAHGGAVHQRLRGWTARVHRCQGDLRRRRVLHGDDARRASGVRLEYLQRLPRRRRDNGGPDPVACARRRPNLRDGFPHRRLHGSGEDLDARPQVARWTLWSERAGNPGEGLCRSEASVVASEERLAKRGGPIHALHDGRSGASYAQPATTPEFPMTGEDHMAFRDRQPKS